MASQHLSQSDKMKGTCPVCSEHDICIIARTGTLRKHGHSGGNPMCAGSYGPPSSSTAPSQPSIGSEASGRVPVAKRITNENDSDGRRASTAATSSSQPSIAGSDSALNATSDDLSAGVTATSGDSSSTLFDLPRLSGGILKWIRKGARLAASNVLVKLLQAVTSHPDDVSAWRRLLGVAGVAFVKPQR